MIIIKRKKFTNNFADLPIYSKYYYVFDSNHSDENHDKNLRTVLTADDIVENPDKEFEVKFGCGDTSNAYVVTDNGNELDIGYTKKDIVSFF